MSRSVDPSAVGPTPDSTYDSNEIPVLIRLPDLRQRAKVDIEPLASALPIGDLPNVGDAPANRQIHSEASQPIGSEAEPAAEPNTPTETSKPPETSEPTTAAEPVTPTDSPKASGPSPASTQGRSRNRRDSRWISLSSNAIVAVFLLAITAAVYVLVQGLPNSKEVSDKEPWSSSEELAPDTSEIVIDAGTPDPEFNEDALWSSNDVTDFMERKQEALPIVGPVERADATRSAGSLSTSSGSRSAIATVAETETEDPSAPTFAIPSRRQETNSNSPTIPVFTYRGDEDRFYSEQRESTPDTNIPAVNSWPDFTDTTSDRTIGEEPPSGFTTSNNVPYPNATSSIPNVSNANVSNANPPTSPALRTGMHVERPPLAPDDNTNSGGAQFDGNVLIPQPRESYERSRPSLH